MSDRDVLAREVQRAWDKEFTGPGGHNGIDYRQARIAVETVLGHADGTVPADRPPIVCLCGSTRFYEEFRRANLRLTLAGEIVLSIGCDTKSDGDLAAAGDLGHDGEQVKARLDELHRRKIDLADYVLVLNVGGYVGESTRGEIEYARSLGKPVRWLEGAEAA